MGSWGQTISLLYHFRGDVQNDPKLSFAHTWMHMEHMAQKIHTHASTIIPALIKNKKIQNKYMFFFKNPYLMNHTLNRIVTISYR